VLDGQPATISERPKGVTRTAAPRPNNAAIHPVTSAVASTGNSNGAQPKRIAEFFTRNSYEIDRSKFLSWSDWETYYLKIADHADNLAQLIKLDDDNVQQCFEFSKAVKPAVYDGFRERISAIAKRIHSAPRLVEQSDAERVFES
jgi:hypothetical protein